MTRPTSRCPRREWIPRLALRRALLVAVLLTAGAVAGTPALPAAEQTPGPLAPPPATPGAAPADPSAAPADSATPVDPAASPAGTETPTEQRERLLVEALRRPDGWVDVRERITAKLVDFVPAVGAALLVLLVFYVLYRITAKVLHGLLRRTHADPAVQEIGLRLVKMVLLGFGLVMAASQLGFQVASLLAGVGIVGLAVGLAAQDSLSNLVAGITILWDHPFRIGDQVTISGTYGRVKQIGLRATTIVTVENIDAILPNKDVINQKILNHTMTPELRLGIPVGIGYGEDVRAARRVLLAAVEGHPMVLADPAPKVVVTELGESSVNLELRVWLTDPHREREAFFAMVEIAKAALNEAGIEIPFPQRTLHLAGDGPVAVEVRERAGG